MNFQMKSNPSSIFGLATILAFLTFPILAQTPAGIPSLDEMAGAWLPMNDVANPPDVNNFHDMLLVNRDLTSFFCNPEDWLWGGADEVWHAGYPLVTLTIAGKEYPAAECRWYPYRALRRNTNCAGLVVQTDTRMINEQRAVLVRIEITNPGPTETNAEFTLSVPGGLWPDHKSVLNLKQRPGFVTAICPAMGPMQSLMTMASFAGAGTCCCRRKAAAKLNLSRATGTRRMRRLSRRM